MSVRSKMLVLMSSLFLLSSVAYAAKWVSLGRDTDALGAAYTSYIDAESVSRNGDQLIYWTMDVYDDTTMMDAGVKTVRTRMEANLSTRPRKFRTLESYSYYADGSLKWHDTVVKSWWDVDDAASNKEVDTALEYAK